jgi:hypothetical protein
MQAEVLLHQAKLFIWIRNQESEVTAKFPNWHDSKISFALILIQKKSTEVTWYFVTIQYFPAILPCCPHLPKNK